MNLKIVTHKHLGFIQYYTRAWLLATKIHLTNQKYQCYCSSFGYLHFLIPNLSFPPVVSISGIQPCHDEWVTFCEWNFSLQISLFWVTKTKCSTDRSLLFFWSVTADFSRIGISEANFRLKKNVPRPPREKKTYYLSLWMMLQWGPPAQIFGHFGGVSLDCMVKVLYYLSLFPWSTSFNNWLAQLTISPPPFEPPSITAPPGVSLVSGFGVFPFLYSIVFYSLGLRHFPSSNLPTLVFLDFI